MNNTQPTTVNRHSSLEERQAALVQIYYQVLERQPYAYERKILAQAEKDFLKDKIGVRRFLKELGHSEVYLNSFYDSASNLKFLEWCFKHFMGRTFANQEEMRLYCDLLMQKGVQSVVTAILDSEEYRKVFGCFTVPYHRERKQYASPKAYLESEIIHREHFGQRGKIVPTIHWHELGLDCNGGVCRHPEADEILDPPPSEDVDELEQKLLDLFKAMKENPTKEVLSSLTPDQQKVLRQAIR